MSYQPEKVPKGDGVQKEEERQQEEQLDLLAIKTIETARRQSLPKRSPVVDIFYVGEPPPEESIRELIGINEGNLPEIIKTIQDRIIKINFGVIMIPFALSRVWNLSKDPEQELKYGIEVSIAPYDFQAHTLSPQETSIFIKRKKQELEKINELLNFLKKEFNSETQTQKLEIIDQWIKFIKSLPDQLPNPLPSYDSSLDGVGYGYYDCYQELLNLFPLEEKQNLSKPFNDLIKYLEEVLRSKVQTFLEVLQSLHQNPERHNDYYYHRVISKLEGAIEKRKESMRRELQVFQTEKLGRRIILRFIFLCGVMRSVNHEVKLKGALLESGINQRALEIISNPEIEKQIWIAVFGNPNCEIIFDWGLVRNHIKKYKEQQEFSEQDITGYRYREDIRITVGTMWVIKCFVEYLQRILPENLFNRLQAPSDVLKDLKEFNLPDFVIDF
jgi:hypothetical protein